MLLLPYKIRASTTAPKRVAIEMLLLLPYKIRASTTRYEETKIAESCYYPTKLGHRQHTLHNELIYNDLGCFLDKKNETKYC